MNLGPFSVIKYQRPDLSGRRKTKWRRAVSVFELQPDGHFLRPALRDKPDLCITYPGSKLKDAEPVWVTASPNTVTVVSCRNDRVLFHPIPLSKCPEFESIVVVWYHGNTLLPALPLYSGSHTVWIPEPTTEGMVIHDVEFRVGVHYCPEGWDDRIRRTTDAG